MRLFLILIIWMAGATGLWADDLARGPEPDWVGAQPVPEMPADLLPLVHDGAAYLLVESQVMPTPDGQSIFSRYATQATDRSGLEEVATVTWSFDPVFETVRLTRLDLIRAGKTVSLRDNLPAEVFRRETRLDEGIIDGTQTVHLQVPDVRVGDIVDYSFVVESRPYVPGAQIAASAALEFSVPVALTRRVLFWPKGAALMVKPVPDRVEYRASERDGLVRHEWVRVAHRPFPDEPMVPPGYEPEARLRVSGWQDWSGLATALSPYYLKDYPLTDGWEEKLRALQRDHESADDRAIAALRLVQDEIRYVGVEIGAGGYFARLPQQVISDGFGDCKDKSLLLRTLLTRLGITAQVALADTDRGHALIDDVPRVGAFDHMIVRAQIRGKTFWMDPTGSYEAGDLDHAVTPDYGYALPLSGAEQKDLEPLTQTTAMGWRNDRTETFDFGLLGVALSVRTDFEGREANWQRYHWATTPVDEIAWDYLEYYGRLYPGIRQVTPPRFEDDRKINRFRVTETYFIPAPALFENGLREDFPFQVEDFADDLDLSMPGTRLATLDLGGAEYYRRRIKVANAPISFSPPDRVVIDNEGFFYQFSGQEDGDGGLVLDWVYRTKTRALPPQDVARIAVDARKAGQSTYFTWDLRP